MQIQINFKSPDCVEDAVQNYASDDNPDFTPEELRKALSKFVKYGEYCLIEFDLEAGTAKVIPA